MFKTLGIALCALTVVTGSAVAQALPEYLDIGRVQVRGDKTKEYEDSIKKMAEVNRKYKGDRWIALGTEYGDFGTLTFSSSRENLAAVETAAGAFMKALTEVLGTMGDKLLRDLGAWSSSYHTELRHRRWDLSVNAPSNAADLAKVVGESRWVRLLKVDLKPGKNPEYIDAWKGFQTELAQVQPRVTALVSEASTGTPALYVAVYYKSLAEMDAQVAGARKALASESYQNLTRVTGNTVSMSNWELNRIRPELSCPPDEIVNVDPTFWKPKPTPAAKPKLDTADRKAAK